MPKLVMEVESFRGQKFVQIVEQEVRGEAFGEFIASNGFHLESDNCPGVMHNLTLENGMWVRGQKAEKDNLLVEVPNEDWLAQLREAVSEYNEDPVETSSIQPLIEMPKIGVMIGHTRFLCFEGFQMGSLLVLQIRPSFMNPAGESSYAFEEDPDISVFKCDKFYVLSTYDMVKFRDKVHELNREVFGKTKKDPIVSDSGVETLS